MNAADTGLFFGRFHPLLVHLPIGFLLLAAILAIIGRTRKYRAIQPAVSFSLLAGCICAVFSCVTGFLLADSGDYNEETVSLHMWAAIITTVLSLAAFLLSTGRIPNSFLRKPASFLATIFGMLLMIGITGHFGGTLTHGAGYLSTDLLFGARPEKRIISELNEAVIYDDLVAPILEKKCGNCHNSNEKKGELSFETFVAIMAGGKHGKVIQPGEATKSEMIKRVMLDPEDEKFMPSDGKPPLTIGERNVLIWWIDKARADKTKKVSEAVASSDVKKDIQAVLGLTTNEAAGGEAGYDSAENAILQLKLPPITEQQIGNIEKAGFIVKHIHLKPAILDITLPSNPKLEPASLSKKLSQLQPVKAHILWLNLSGNNVSDDQLQILSSYNNLQRLRLDNNPLTDSGIKMLQSLTSLQSINLYNTKVSQQSITVLSRMPNLKSIYVWGTGINSNNIQPDSLKRVITGVN